MGEIAVGFASKWAAAKEELVCAYAKGPPVDGVGVAAPCENLGCHVGHAPCDAGEQATAGIVDGDVEVCEVGIATLVEEDVVGLEISKGKLRDGGRQGRETNRCMMWFSWRKARAEDSCAM